MHGNTTREEAGVAKASMVSKILDAAAKGVAGVDEALRNPMIFSGIHHDLGAISARLDDVVTRLSRLEVTVGQRGSGNSRTGTPKPKRASRRTRR
jgi:hypothetical protein